jgi:hypothetical protein
MFFAPGPSRAAFSFEICFLLSKAKKKEEKGDGQI